MSLNFQNNIKKINYFKNINNYYLLTSHTDLNILYFNARTIRNKMSDIQIFINSFKCPIHVIIITETRLYSEENVFYDIQGFKAYHSNRSKNNVKNQLNIGHTGRGGGVAVYVHQNISSTFVYEEYIDNNNYLIVNLIQMKTHIIALYKPPVRVNENKFINKIETLLAKYKNAFIIGDMNMDLLNRTDESISYYTETIESLGYVLLNKIERQYATRVTDTSATLIDHILTDNVEHDFNLLTDDLWFSDHKYLLLAVKSQCESHALRNISHNKVVINYEKLDNHHIWNNLDRVHSFIELINNLISAINENKTEITSKTKIGNEPWVSSELLEVIRERNKFYRYKLKYKNDSYVNEKFQEYKRHAKTLNDKLKKEWFGKKLESNIESPRKFWLYLKYAVFNKRKTNNKIVILKNEDTITDPIIISNEFNSHFIAMPEKLVSNISSQTLLSKTFMDNLIYGINTEFVLDEINENQVGEIIRSLKPNVACGVYQISTKFVQRYSDKLTPVLQRLINRCLENKIFPDILKTAKIIPIHKSGAETNVDNFRPIAILNVFSKIFEKIIFSSLIRHFETNSIISSKQFGFLEKSNTTAACMELTHFISTSLDKKQTVSCIFIDLSKAFDTVDRLLLLEKLGKAGIRKENLCLFESYLTNRIQTVYVNETYSKFNASTLGVPQGSNLGPLLFIFFVNDICKLKLLGDIQLFADDIVIKYKSCDQKTLYSQMQRDMNMLNEWFNNNKLIVNAKKTKYMVFKYRENRLEEEQQLRYNGDVLERVKQYRYLGLIITDDFKWEKHIDQIKIKVNPYIFALKKLKNILPKKSLELIYYAFIYSQLIYLNPIWSGCTQTKLNQLYVLQKRALKQVMNVHWMHPTKNLFEDEYKSLLYLIKHERLLLMFKVTNNLIKNNFELKKMHNVHDHETRRRSHYNIEFFASDMCEQNVLYKGLCEFNELPTEIKEINYIGHFKKYLKEYLQNIY